MSTASHPTNPESATLGQRDVPSVNWSDFLDRFNWEQGEHVTLIGPTGCGKTSLALQLLRLRRFVVVFVTKRRDDTMDGLRREYEVQRNLNTEVANRILLWPVAKHIDKVHESQRDTFADALNTIYLQGGWCAFCDETTYLSDFLGLKKHLGLLWQQGRSLGVSLVAATQRPAYIPLYAYDQATHLFIWRDNDRENLSRLSGLGGIDSDIVRSIVPRLEKHEVLYLDTRTGNMLRTVPEVN